MFIGQYVGKLDKRGYIALPKPYRKILKQEATDGRALIFVPAASLRIYSQAKGRLYLKALEESALDTPARRPAIQRLIRLTHAEGFAFCSLAGAVPIPDIFMQMYGFSPGKELTLYGCGEYIELAAHPGCEKLQPL